MDLISVSVAQLRPSSDSQAYSKELNFMANEASTGEATASTMAPINTAQTTGRVSSSSSHCELMDQVFLG